MNLREKKGKMPRYVVFVEQYSRTLAESLELLDYFNAIVLPVGSALRNCS
jgi:hypothetical protein